MPGFVQTEELYDVSVTIDVAGSIDFEKALLVKEGINLYRILTRAYGGSHISPFFPRIGINQLTSGKRQGTKAVPITLLAPWAGNRGVRCVDDSVQILSSLFRAAKPCEYACGT